ncbi:MAG: carbamoyltransferase HypF [Candidatus Omnitrophica bacterium]|nr:carbamoyltransferase HypF [Candidatus Omnitrophota bacterium]
MVKAARIKLEGIVQGVGFRPFVHRLAVDLGISGFVLNTSDGVEIHAEADPKKLKSFFLRLKNELPPLARLTKAAVLATRPQGLKDFSIRESKKSFGRSCLVSPDISICPDCRKELLNPINRRYLYPFINCTNCGPRFSIIHNVPYDRALTTMKKFKMCPACNREFSDIADRRYHAQPNACPACGPKVTLINNLKPKSHFPAKGAKAIAETIRLLKDGRIAAIKGIGGFHIACDAYNLKTVKKLRDLKNRPSKPFALMVSDIREARKLCCISRLEQTILESPERPIVLLKKKNDSKISSILAPDNNYLGIMLCYAPLHYLMFSPELSAGKPLQALVMTSANISDEPIEIENSRALKNLKSICDCFLVHDRDIYNRCDDSIVQVMDNRPILLRRSRGYSPFPFFTDLKFKPILSCGAELKNTFCLAQNRSAFLSQYIGDLKTCASFGFYKEAIQRLSKLFQIKPRLIVHDLHPDYLPTRYSQELAAKNKFLKTVAIQHHQAHLASVIAEQRIKKNIIGVCFDGIGYGEDRKVWGGEFFTGGLRGLRRAGHLEYVPLPGGDKATLEPFRMAISYLYIAYGKDIYDLKLDFLKRHEKKLESIVNVSALNSIQTSSCGRLFDAVSALLGICDIITYEAQAAIRLQRYAEKSSTLKSYRFLIDDTQDMLVIKSRELISGIVKDLEHKVAKEEIARKFHNSIAAMARQVCRKLREKTGFNIVCLSGGVFQNSLLLEHSVKLLREDKFQVYYNELLPANDGAISLGQAAIANQICA